MDQDVKFAHICRLFIKPKKNKKDRIMIHNFQSQQFKSNLAERILQCFMYQSQPSLHDENKIKPNCKMNLK